MKVLVVEDEWLVRELIVGELLDAGFDVVEAESGEAAPPGITSIIRTCSSLTSDYQGKSTAGM